MENNQKQELIEVRITNKDKDTRNFKHDINELLEKILIEFAKETHVDYSTLDVLYGRKSLHGEDLKKPLSDIIEPQDRKDKIMKLLVYKSAESNITVKDQIIIVLSIESVKKIEINGKKGEKIKDIIRNSSLLKLDFKWYSFKYRKEEIDLNKKFNDIANNEEKKDLKIELTVNHKIPLKITFVKGKKEIYSTKGLLRDSVKTIINS